MTPEACARIGCLLLISLHVCCIWAMQLVVTVPFNVCKYSTMAELGVHHSIATNIKAPGVKLRLFYVLLNRRNGKHFVTENVFWWQAFSLTADGWIVTHTLLFSFGSYVCYFVLYCISYVATHKLAVIAIWLCQIWKSKSFYSLFDYQVQVR